MAGSSLISDTECSRLEAKEIRTREVKEGVTSSGDRGGYPHPPLMYRFQNKGLANWAVRKCMKTKEGRKAFCVYKKVTMKVERGRGNWEDFRTGHHIAFKAQTSA